MRRCVADPSDVRKALDSERLKLHVKSSDQTEAVLTGGIQTGEVFTTAELAIDSGTAMLSLTGSTQEPVGAPGLIAGPGGTPRPERSTLHEGASPVKSDDRRSLNALSPKHSTSRGLREGMILQGCGTEVKEAMRGGPVIEATGGDAGENVCGEEEASPGGVRSPVAPVAKPRKRRGLQSVISDSPTSSLQREGCSHVGGEGVRESAPAERYVNEDGASDEREGGDGEGGHPGAECTASREWCSQRAAEGAHPPVPAAKKGGEGGKVKGSLNALHAACDAVISCDCA